MVRRFDWDAEHARSERPANGGGGAPVERSVYIRDLWNFLRRNRVVVLGVPLLVLVAALVGTRLVRPVYESAATIRIDEERSNLAILDVLKTLSSGSNIGTEMQVLRSRTLAEAVIDSLALQVRLLEPRGRSRDELVRITAVEREAPAARYEVRHEGSGRFEVRRRGSSTVARVGVGEVVRLGGVSFELLPAATEQELIRLGVEPHHDVLRATRRRIVIGRPSRDADIVEVRYQGMDRALTAAVPNVLADRFISHRNRDHSRESQSTIRFLDEQLGIISDQLTAAESDLQRFRETTGVISLEAEARASIAGLGELKAERDALAAEAAALDQFVTELDRGRAAGLLQERSAITFPTLLRVPAASQLLSALVELEDERAARLRTGRPTDADIVAIDQRIREVEAQIGSIAATYMRGLREQVRSLDATLLRFRADLQQVPAHEIAFARLHRQARTMEEIYTLLQTRLKEQEVLAAVEDVSVRVVDDAVPARRPVRPNIPLTIGLALLVGTVLGVGTAFVREQLDTAVHTREDLQAMTPGVPLLGTIPRMRGALAQANGRPGRKSRAPAEFAGWLAAAHEPQSPAAESYRSLRTSIAFSRAGEPPRTLIFTSPVPGDGKSTSAANLAATFARQGGRCIIVDADLRRGVLHRLFTAAKEPGLSNVLLGRITVADAVQQVSIGDVAIALLASGVTPPNPAELVGSDRMATLLAELAVEYDAVIVDAPPLNLVTDAALLGVHADGVVLVARAGVTDRAAVAYAMEQLHAVRARVLGSVLNDAGDGRDRYYGSYLPDAQEYAAS